MDKRKGLGQNILGTTRLPDGYRKGDHKVARIDVRASERLYNLILKDAERQRISLGEVLTRAYAQQKGVPELGVLDKAKPGPKPKRLAATA